MAQNLVGLIFGGLFLYIATFGREIFGGSFKTTLLYFIYGNLSHQLYITYRTSIALLR